MLSYEKNNRQGRVGSFMSVKIRTDISVSEIYKIAKSEKNAQVRTRLLSIAAILEGKKRGDAAKLAGVTVNNIRTWIRRFNENGFDSLSNKKQAGKKSTWTETIEEYLKEKLTKGADFKADQRVVFRLEDLQDDLNKKFNIKYGISTIWYKIKKLGFSWISVRRQHPKSNPAAQEEFKKKAPEAIEEVKKKHPNKKIEIWFQDEARIGQHGTLTRFWAQTGSRPRVNCSIGFMSAYIYGAICPALGKSSALIFSHVGSGEMTLHLEEISKTVDEDSHAVIIMDRAPWHQSVIVPKNITILFLPPYAPELNPTEQVWDYMRSNFLSNRVYETIDDVFNACVDAWNLFAKESGVIFTIGTRDWVL